MKNDYPHIFSPLTVKNMTIKNRIVMMPDRKSTRLNSSHRT